MPPYLPDDCDAFIKIGKMGPPPDFYKNMQISLYEPQGDLHIVCHDRHFYVSTDVMLRVSSGIGEMLTPELIAVYEKDTKGKIVIALPDVNPEAFNVFCNLVYSGMGLVKSEPQPFLLRPLLEFIDQYKCRDRVSPTAQSWLRCDLESRPHRDLWMMLVFAYRMNMGALFRVIGKRLISTTSARPPFRDWASIIGNWEAMPESFFKEIQNSQDRLLTKAGEAILNILRPTYDDLGDAEATATTQQTGRYTESLLQAGLMPGSPNYQKMNFTDMRTAASSLPHDMWVTTQLDMKLQRCLDREDGPCFLCLKGEYCDLHTDKMATEH